MARYDVYNNPDANERTTTPYLLDVQNNFLEVDTRVMVPLHDAGRFRSASVPWTQDGFLYQQSAPTAADG